MVLTTISQNESKQYAREGTINDNYFPKWKQQNSQSYWEGISQGIT